MNDSHHENHPRTRRRRCRAFAFLAAAILAVPAPAQFVYLSAALDGAQEVPAVSGVGRGWAVARLDLASSALRVFLFHSDLSGPATQAHVHQAPFGVNGGILVGLTPASASSFTASAVLSPAQASALLVGDTYVNVHTVANFNGEIRGQLVPARSTRFTGRLEGSQVVPPTGSAGTGDVAAFLHEPENRLVYFVSTSRLANITGGQVQIAPRGANGPLAFPLSGGSGLFCGVSRRLTLTEVGALNVDRMYVNILTTAFGSGELRAQLQREAGDQFVAAITGSEVVPPTASRGIGSATLVQAGGTILVQGSFTGLGGPPIDAHVRLGPPGSNGPAVFPLVLGGNTFSAIYTPVGADLTNLRLGGWYLEVRTAAFPSGELRGQLLPARAPTTFGEGCPTSAGIRPQIGASGIPAGGGSIELQLYGAPPGAPALFTIGASRDQLGAVPLPMELTAAGLQSPGCFLLVAPASSAAASANALGCAQVLIAVPLSAGLPGARLFGQWFVLDAGANAAGLVTSSALSILLQ